MAYTPKPEAAARREQAARLLREGLAALTAGVIPTAEQQEAIRNAYRTARRATREGVRSANTARQTAIMLQIEDARKAYPAAALRRLQAAQPVQPTAAPAAQPFDPFTGAPLQQAAPLPQNFVL